MFDFMLDVMLLMIPALTVIWCFLQIQIMNQKRRGTQCPEEEYPEVEEAARENTVDPHDVDEQEA